MQAPTPEQLKKLKTLKKMIEMSEEPELATLVYLTELEDRVEALEEEPKLAKGEDGKTPTNEELRDLIRPLIPAPLKGEKGDKGDTKIVEKVIERTEVIKEQPIVTEKITNEVKEVAKYEEPLQIAEKLNTLKEEVGIDVIKDLRKELDSKTNGGVRVIGGRAGIQLYVDGTKQGLVQMVNLIAGAGVTLTYNRNSGRNDITISNDSVAGTVLEATGTRDDSNVDFTFTSEPSIIVINGASYRPTSGSITWTWVGSTATLSAPVGNGGDIYGIR